MSFRRTITFVSFDRVLSLGGPLAIARLIVLSVIDTPNHVSASRTRSHVSEETGETFAPRHVHTDSLRTVPCKLFTSGIVTTLLDLRPTDVLRRALTFWRIAVSLQMNVSSLASAAFCYAISKCQGFYFSLLTADTFAEPQSTSFALVHTGVLKHFPAAELSPRKVDQFLASHHPSLVCRI